MIVFSGFGITAGAHRLFSHKSYKANAKLRLLLTFLFTISGQVKFDEYLQLLLIMYVYFLFFSVMPILGHMIIEFIINIPNQMPTLMTHVVVFSLLILDGCF